MDAPLAWEAKDLPKGLTIEGKIGVIKGIPERKGTSVADVTITRDGPGVT